MNTPQVVRFCNEGLRPSADKLATAYYAAKSLLESYDATGIAASLGNDQTFSDLIEDGSSTDGRPQISAGGVRLTMENIRALITQLESTHTESGLSLVQGILSISPRYAS